MTKYILNSGNATKFPEKLKKFNEEVFRDFLEGEKDDGEIKGVAGNGSAKRAVKVKVLVCLFAMERERWEEKFEVYKKGIIKNASVQVEVEMAMPDKFKEQCRWADVINLSGGDDELLKYRLAEFGGKEGVQKMWANKVVTTSSASADYLVDSFWTCDWRKVMKGTGIIPIKFIPHYNSDYGSNSSRGPINWEEAAEELADYGNKDLSIYALEEGEFIVWKSEEDKIKNSGEFM